MNQSIYTERENILPHHAEWLDGCGAVWWINRVRFSLRHDISEVSFIAFCVSDNTFLTSYDESYTHIPTGTEFCECVAEILGLEKPLFGVDKFIASDLQVGISKTETTSHKFKVGDLVKIKNFYNDQTKETTGKIVKPTNPMRYHVETKEDGFYVFDEVDLELLENNNLSMTINAGLPNDDGMGITEKLFQSLAEKWHESNSILSLPDYMGITKEEYKMLVEQKTTIKGMAIEVSRLSEEDRSVLIYWLGNYSDNIISLAEENKNNVNSVGYGDSSFGWSTKDWYQNNGITITESPAEFLKYVAQQTGKEYKKEWGQTHGNPRTSQPVSESYKFKTYRILDSLDGIPLDKRIPLSEWIPPVGKKVLLITKDWFMDGYFDRVESKIIFETVKGSKASSLDGHWMRIV